MYLPNQDTSTDESLMIRKRHLSFLQNLPLIPQQFGINIFKLYSSTQNAENKMKNEKNCCMQSKDVSLRNYKLTWVQFHLSLLKSKQFHGDVCSNLQEDYIGTFQQKETGRNRYDWEHIQRKRRWRHKAREYCVWTVHKTNTHTKYTFIFSFSLLVHRGLCEISGSYSSKYEDKSILGYGNVNKSMAP